MNEKDIKTYLKAKKEEFASKVLVALSMLCVVSIIVLDALVIEHDYTIVLACFSSVFLLGSVGSSRWVTVSRSELLSILKKQIDSDPEALQLMAKIRSSHERG